jgi:hypothetical protein
MPACAARFSLRGRPPRVPGAADLRAAAIRHQRAVSPPSTTSSLPVQYDDSSLARK